MIQIYSPYNTNYDYNGDVVLRPMSCVLDSTLNGAWTLTLEHPYDAEERWRFIENGAVIKALTDYNNQLFRIYDCNRLSNTITATAYPIFLDAAKEVMLMDVRPTNKNGQETLDIMTSGSRYSVESDIDSIHTAHYIRKNLIEAISGDDENSFLNLWGGEIFYNNYNATINKNLGNDNGVVVGYGRNMTGVDIKTNIDTMVTRIIPKAYNGYMLDGDSPWVDSPIINSYPLKYISVREYEDIKLKADCSEEEFGYETLAELRKALVERAKSEFDNGIDKPSVNISVNMSDLSKCDAYKDYEMLESINLGDTVRCRHSKLGIDIKNRVINIKYDCLLNKIISVELGEYQNNYFDNLRGNSSQQAAQLNTISENMSNSEIVYNIYSNTSVYNIDSSKRKIIALVYQTKAKKNGFFEAQILCEASEDTEISFEYRIDDAILKFNPVQILQKGKHIIALMYPLENIEPNILHNFDVYCTSSHGIVNIENGNIKAVVYGQGMASLAFEWDGTLTFDENFDDATISSNNLITVRTFEETMKSDVQVPASAVMVEQTNHIPIYSPQNNISIKPFDYNLLVTRVSISKTFSINDMLNNMYISDEFTLNKSYDIHADQKEIDKGFMYCIPIDKTLYEIESIAIEQSERGVTNNEISS